MAKRKAAKRKAARRKAVSTRKAGRTRSPGKKTASAAKRAAARKKATKKTVRRTAKVARSRTTTTAKARKANRSTKARPQRTARRIGKVVKRAAPGLGKVAKAAAPVARKAAAPKAKVERLPPRTAPALKRERPTLVDEDDVVPSPPSSLDFDRTASAARSGRRELREKYAEHTETSPALTGGDVDADWESAYSVGDEAPGGDNPTPDQDVVDEIGRAVGVEYQDNEELKGEAKIAKRDRNRWELDPASSDDWEER
jgi:hypothetical protein